MKRLFFSLVALLLATTAIRAYDFKAGDLYYNITSTTDLTAEVTYQYWKASNNYLGLTTVNVPATVENEGTTYTVTAIGDVAFASCATLTTVTLPNTITLIGSQAFEQNTGLTTINLPEGLTTIDSYAFYETAIQQITLPSTLTTIGSHLFCLCSKLTDITIPDGVTAIPDLAFARCTALTTVTLGSGVTSIGNNVFRECPNLSTITLPAGLKNIGEGAFYRCESLDAITLPDGLESIGDQAFFGCGMFNIIVPSSVTSIGDYAFGNFYNVAYNGTATGSPWGANNVNAFVEGDLIYADDTKTTLLLARRTISGNVVIPNSVETIAEGAFAACEQLQSVTFEGSVTTIEEGAFAACTSLTAITLPEGIQTIGDYAFYGCTNLASITLPNSLTQVGVVAFDETAWSKSQPDGVMYLGTVLYGYKGTMPAGTNIVINDGTTLIADYAFYDYGNLVGVTMPNSLKSIGISAFYHTNILNCTVPNTVTTVGDEAFEFVPNIAYTGTLEDAPWGARTQNGYVEGNLVYTDNTKTTLSACSTLAAGDIIVPDGVTTIGEKAFGDCRKITSVTIPEGVTTISDEAFDSCDGLKTVTLPSTLTSIGSNAFAWCTRINSVTIPDGVTTIGDYAFRDVTNIVYNGTATGSPWGAKSMNGVIDGYFVYADADKTTLLACCTDATGIITIPNSVTTIQSKAFAYCDRITSVVVPSTITTIGDGAFAFVLNIVYNGDLTGAPWSARSLNGYAEGIFAYTDATKTTLIACASGATGDIIVPDGVTAIGMGAFEDCWDATSVTLPASVDSLGWYVFGYSGITSITVLIATPPYADEQTFYNVSDNLTIHIPCGALAAYTDENSAWSEFTDQFVEPFDYTLSVTSQDDTMGAVRITKEATCSDDTAIFEAIANEGYLFKQWSDGNTDNPRSVTVDEDMSFVAQFESAPAALDALAVPNQFVQKLLRNGQVYILRGGKTYTPTGVEVR